MKYLKLLGCLSHLARMTRPDILQAVFHLALFMAHPTQHHYDGLVCICTYLKWTLKMGIRFSKVPVVWILKL